MSGPAKTKNLTPQQVSAMLKTGQALLIDVREPAEFAADRIHGALNFPLSTFDPKALPRSMDRTIVFQCGSGKRSATAVERCQAQDLRFDSHLAGGIAAWRAAGLPTVGFDPNTGAVRDAR
jgi:rhodanese-related sulfurtransferase